MDVWGWIAVYAVGLTLLQLLVYRYLLNSGGSVTRRVGSPFGDREEGDSSLVDGSASPSNDSGSRSSTGSSSGSGSGSRLSSTNDDTGGGESGSSRPRGRDAWPEAPTGFHPLGASTESPETTDAGTDGRPCRHCGAVNEADTTFTRCWNCAGEL